MVDGCLRKLVNVVSEVPHGSVLGLVIVPPVYLRAFLHSVEWGNQICRWLHIDSSFVQSPGVRGTVAESLSSDIVNISEWCDLWGIKFNGSKKKTMIVSMSRTMHLQSPTLTIGGTVLKESDDHVSLGVTIDSKMTSEKHFRSYSFSKAWYLEEVLASIPWFIASLEILFLGGSAVLQCGVRLPIHTLNYWTV